MRHWILIVTLGVVLSITGLPSILAAGVWLLLYHLINSGVLQ